MKFRAWDDRARKRMETINQIQKNIKKVAWFWIIKRIVENSHKIKMGVWSIMDTGQQNRMK